MARIPSAEYHPSAMPPPGAMPPSAEYYPSAMPPAMAPHAPHAHNAPGAVSIVVPGGISNPSPKPKPTLNPSPKPAPTPDR